jgi:hypothetical protein
MNTLWKKVQEKIGMEIHSFMTLCALAGNDYLSKNIATHNIGVPVLCEAVKRSNRAIMADPKLKNIETLKVIVRWCHTQLIDGAKFLSPAKMTEIAVENGSRKRAKKRKTTDATWKEGDEKKEKPQAEDEEDEDDGEEQEEEGEEEELSHSKSKLSVNSALVRVPVSVPNVYKPSEALVAYSQKFINEYWAEKKSKKITGIPPEVQLKKCLERLEFSLWFWEHQPFSNKRFEQTLSISTLTPSTSSSSSSSSSSS